MTEDEDVHNLLNAVRDVYGYDFTQYALASIKRRVAYFMEEAAIPSVKALQAGLLRDEALFERFIRQLTVNVTEMFRDPGFYLSLRENVMKRLATYPVIRIWIAGCSTGEEVYSMLIMLDEEGLLEKSVIYATDINQEAVQRAKEGVFRMGDIKSFTQNYIAAGGKKSLSDYYMAKYDAVLMHKALRENVVFAVHNLANDSSFNEFQMISCRNVLIYFNQQLQNKVINLFYESLCPFGIFCLGTKESLLFSEKSVNFKPVDKRQRIFIKSH